MENGDFDPLLAYAQWVLAQPLGRVAAPQVHDAVHDYGLAVTSVIHRQGQFQTEFVVVQPHCQLLVAHGHPNIDSIEVHVQGRLHFHLDGKKLATPEEIESAHARGVRAPPLRVPPGAMHGADVGPGGAMFLSIQHWINGVGPSSVALDWDGAPMNEGHSKLLTEG